MREVVHEVDCGECKVDYLTYCILCMDGKTLFDMARWGHALGHGKRSVGVAL